MIKKTVICLLLAIFFASTVICTAKPTISQGYDSTNIPGYDFTALPASTTPISPITNSLPSNMNTSAGSSYGSPPKDVDVGEPPATIPAISPPNAPTAEEMPKSISAASSGTSAGLGYPAISGFPPTGFLLESWDAGTSTWTTDPISLQKGSTWHWRLTNLNTQNVWFKKSNSPWISYTFNPMYPQWYYGSTYLSTCFWNAEIAYGAQDGLSNPIWCYVVCPTQPLKIQITPPGYQGPTPKSVTINYKVNKPCTVQFMVNMPGGPYDTGPMSVYGGLNSFLYPDSGPSGNREVVGLAWTATETDADKQVFTV